MKAKIDIFKEKLPGSHIDFKDVAEFIATWEQSGDLFQAGGFFISLKDKRWAYIHYNDTEKDWTTYNERTTLEEIEKEYKLQALKVKWNRNPADLNIALGNKPGAKKAKNKHSGEYTYHAVWKTYEQKPVALFKDERIAKQFVRQNIKNVLWEIKPFTFQEIS